MYLSLYVLKLRIVVHPSISDSRTNNERYDSVQGTVKGITVRTNSCIIIEFEHEFSIIFHIFKLLDTSLNLLYVSLIFDVLITMFSLVVNPRSFLLKNIGIQLRMELKEIEK